MAVPTIAEELTRKVLETLTAATVEYEKGDITEREFFYIRRTLFEATSGLIDPDIKALTYAEEPDDRTVDVKMLRHPDGRAVVIYSFYGHPLGTVWVANVHNGKCTYFTPNESATNRASLVDKLYWRLRDGGFEPLSFNPDTDSNPR